MAFAVTGRKRERTENINETPNEVLHYVCDSILDLKNLPVYPEIRIGSTAYFIKTKECMILGSEGWEPI